MKKILALMLALLMVIGVVAGCSTPAADAPADTTEPTGDVAMQYMTADEAAAVLGTDGYLFLDVRKAADYEISHIPGAVSADMDAAKNGDAEAGKATMTAATEGVDATIVLVCYSGKAYAQASTNALSAIGYDMSKVYTLEGGFNNWKEAKADLVEGTGATEAPEADSTVRTADPNKTEIIMGGTQSFLNYLSFLPEKMGEWGYTVTFQAFDDTVTPDIALAEGSIDANFYQHKPYLEQYNAANGTDLYACEPTLIASFESVVSKKYTSLDQLPDGAKIAIADDSSNMSFDLHSLAHLGLIELAEIPEGSYYTTFDITANPHNFEIIPMPMMQRYTALDDVDAACMFYSARAAEMYEFNILTIITDDPDIMFPIVVAVDGKNKDEQWVSDMMEAIAGDELRAVMNELNNPNLTWNILF